MSAALTVSEILARMTHVEVPSVPEARGPGSASAMLHAALGEPKSSPDETTSLYTSELIRLLQNPAYFPCRYDVFFDHKVYSMACDGATLGEIADALEVSILRLYHWADLYPSFNQILRGSMDACLNFWLDMKIRSVREAKASKSPEIDTVVENIIAHKIKKATDQMTVYFNHLEGLTNEQD